jgi:hypothetical protein
MAVSFAQTAFTPTSPAFAAAARGSFALRVEPAQRVIAPAGTFGATAGAETSATETGTTGTGTTGTGGPAPFGGDARAALARVEIVGPGTSSRSGDAQAPFSGGRPGILVDQGGIQLSQAQAGQDTGQVTGQTPDTEKGDPAPPPTPGTTSATGETLTEEEQKVVEELKARDAEVRRHEQAHAAVGGQYAGSPSYTYQQGPDGGRYAVGGEVSIDASPIEGDPEATILKLQTVRRAALAPAEPSAQDQSVAAAASAGIAQAQAELSAQNREERQGTAEDGDTAQVSDIAPTDGPETTPDQASDTGAEDVGPFSIAAQANSSDRASDTASDFAGERSANGGISAGVVGGVTGASGTFGGQQSRIISIAV